jgi:hypothetical protein
MSNQPFLQATAATRTKRGTIIHLVIPNDDYGKKKKKKEIMLLIYNNMPGS